MATISGSQSHVPGRDRPRRPYVPAIGQRLRPWLWAVLGGFALMGANGAYLSAVTALTWYSGTTQQTWFYMMMVAVHLLLGFAIIVPFLAFGLAHLATSWNRPNKAAVRYGLVLLAASFVILISGLVLVRFGGFEIRDPKVRAAGYWLHVGAPLVAIGLYIKHRLAGPRIKWYWLGRWGAGVAVAVAAMAMLHAHDPSELGAKGPKDGDTYFFPSEAITADGKYIPAKTLMMDDYCLKCHKDAYDGWFHSSHHNSSFNNKAYLASVRETRQVSLKAQGDTNRARWCAGCHDPVPFFSGEFDDPNYDDVNTPSSQAGITCTACHAITHVNSTRGNADYTIEEPKHYPFAYSDNPVLKWVNEALVKAKPEMHKKTFLKPVIKTKEFCSACHKVGIPFALNDYKDFLRGQNHWDPFLLSGVSGGNAKAFYYPPKAKSNCVECHMNFIPSTDFGARDFDGTPGREIHNHMFPGANTGMAAIRGRADEVEAHAKYLREGKVRVDLFALREGGSVEGALLGPIRPVTPTLRPGASYLIETVVRTLGVGHPLTQGTVDSNEIWVELIAKVGDRIIGRSGGIDESGKVDPYSHFINVYMLDRDGHRIDRRNPQDIFVPLYNKQIPPGAGQVVHFGLDVPEGLVGPITLEAKVNYRKFDRTYMDYIFGPGKGPDLPVVVMATDSVRLPVEGEPAAENPPSPIKDAWQRWNDYGIGLFLEGSDKGGQKGELKQAEPVFRKVAELGKAEGWVNLTRVYQREGRIPDARDALAKAAAQKEPAAPWTIAWLTGQINERNGYLDEAIANYESVLATVVPARGFDFGGDYDVLNALGNVAYLRARAEPLESPDRDRFLRKSIVAYRKTLSIDSENVNAHNGLGLAYSDLARGEPSEPAGTPGTPGTPASALMTLAKSAADPSRPVETRLAEARAVRANLAAFLAAPRDKTTSRLNLLHELVGAIGPAFERDADPSARAATASTLSALHKSLHAMFKPDESAEGRAQANARRENPAADRNAQSIVIHPLHRPGAPGLSGPAEVQADSPPRTSREAGQ